MYNKTEHNNFIYDKTGNLLSIAFDKGRLVPNGAGGYRLFNYELGIKNYELQSKDDCVAIPNSSFVIRNYYYPFGMTMPNLSYNAFTTNPSLGKDNKFMYNGKELQTKEFGSTGLDWYDYGARNLDVVTCRWWVIDHQCAKYFNWSPYQYALNNPNAFMDNGGEDVYVVIHGEAILINPWNLFLNRNVDNTIVQSVVKLFSTSTGFEILMPYTFSNQNNIYIAADNEMSGYGQSPTQKNYTGGEVRPFDENGIFQGGGNKAFEGLTISDENLDKNNYALLINETLINNVAAYERTNPVVETAETMAHEIDAHISFYLQVLTKVNIKFTDAAEAQIALNDIGHEKYGNATKRGKPVKGSKSEKVNKELGIKRKIDSGNPYMGNRLYKGDAGYLGSYWETYDIIRNWQ